jgi:hypothetical protein
MAATRYTAMFRVAAVVFLLFGCAWIWRFGFTDYAPQYRLVGISAGALALLVGAFLMRPAKLAIAMSAVAAAFVGICAAAAAPVMHGPVILAFAALALLLVIYAVLAARVLFQSTH